MADEEPDIRMEFEREAMSELAATKALALKKDQIGIAQLLVGQDNEDTLSALRRKDPELWARFHYYLKVIKAAYDMDAKGGRFVFPDPEPMLEARALLMKRSVGARIVEALKSISHITEGGTPQRRGLLGRK